MTENISALQAPDGILLCRSVLDGAQLTALTSKIDARYRELDAARPQGDPAVVQELIGPGLRFVPAASSLSLGAILSGENFRAFCAGILASPAGAWIKNESRGHIVCDFDHAWVRRQYALRNYPPHHAPHSWHQDGALGFDFLSHPGGRFPPDALLPMATCWIALGPCGADAPGFELVTRRLGSLLAPAELTAEGVRPRFAPEEFWRPVLEAGDALLFRGDILHRTHITPAMTRDRTSLELRFFPADSLPARLRDNRFIPLV